MKWGKAAAVGAVGSLVMFIIMYIGIHVTGIAPFKVPPSAAFLIKFGIPAKPLALIGHFGYGAFWSVALVYFFAENTDVIRGLAVAIGLWLFMMLIHSPMIGWGFFGFGSTYSEEHRLFLESAPKYVVITLVLHLIYGIIIGWGIPLWLDLKEE